MIIFKTLTIQNFLSYGNNSTKIDLNKNNPTLITGINYDASVNGELDSNGCGKSSILNALSYVLYNKDISINGKLDDLINNINGKDMLVTLVFTKDSKDYRISRYRKNKAMGGDGVLIEQKKGKSWKDITTTKPDTQISDAILQIPFTVFNRIIGYAAGEEPFLKMGLPKQREVIDELFEYTELVKRANIIKEKVKDLKKDLEYARESNQSIKDEAMRHKEQLVSLTKKSSDWKTNSTESLQEMHARLNDLESIDYNNQEQLLELIASKKTELSKLLSELKQHNKDLSNAKSQTAKFLSFDEDNEKEIGDTLNLLQKEIIEDFNEEQQTGYLNRAAELGAEIEELKQSLNSYTRTKSSYETKLEKIQGELTHLSDSKCPYCLQKYEEAKQKISDLQNETADIQDNLVELEKEISRSNSSLSNCAAELKTIKEEFLIFDDKESMVSYITKIDKLKDRFDNLKSQTNPYEDMSKDVEKLEAQITTSTEKVTQLESQIHKAEAELLFDSTEQLFTAKSKIESLKDRIEEKKKEENPYDEMLEDLKGYKPKASGKDKEIAELENTIKHSEFLIKLLTKKDSYLRKALMDKYLPMLNKRLHHYLTVMSLPHRVMFNSDLSTEISQFGKTIPYGNLSAGQKARINIALSLSFRDVLQSKHNFINLFILDECLDVGLSNVGVRKTVKAIKEVAKTNKLSMFVISHRDEAKDSFPDRLEIELRNGFSSIKA